MVFVVLFCLLFIIKKKKAKTKTVKERTIPRAFLLLSFIVADVAELEPSRRNTKKRCSLRGSS